MTNGKRLCLNMIVRNETANLARCLGAVADQIACWVIGDTGSTDGTQDLIEAFFRRRGIPGELHAFPFENFAQARNEALDRARSSSLGFDYLLLTDADMELVVRDAAFRAGLRAPAYQVMQKAGISYWNIRLVRRDAAARYRGVTHEYLEVAASEQLRDVWFIDHATGSNRVDKAERDIRLLEQATRREPDDARSWFYLAQSYADAGRTAEAAETYARRAAMGGWEEEAWFARLQQARCRRKLGDEGGFLRQALAAYDARPHRAEPLYDLARFHRERGMHASAVLFCEAGLAVPWPDRDTLFIEDFVYDVGLKEELSIAAFYVADAERRERGRRLCDRLALGRDVPEASRNLARYNSVFYAARLEALMPSFAARPVGFEPPDGYRPMNPSVARWGDRLWLVQRAVNFELGEGGEYSTPDDGPVHTRNFLLGLDDGLRVISAAEILPPDDLPAPRFDAVRGFEDCRLFAWRDRLWCSSVVRELAEEGWCEIVLARIDGAGTASCRFADWRVLHPQGPRQNEKNWMPQVSGDSLRFIYSVDPTRVVDDEGRAISEAMPACAAEHLRGGSPLVEFDGGRLALVHEVAVVDGNRRYLHRFVQFDKENRLHALSRPFFLARKGVEYAAGLAWHVDRERLVVSFGVADREAWLATVEAAEVKRVLKDATRLPWGTPGTESRTRQGRVTEPTPRDAGEIESTSSADQPRFLPTGLDELLRPFQIAKPLAAPAAKSPGSSWVPQGPAGGTEIMVGGLRERMGRELDRINLGVNHPGHDNTDKRPRVVWMHHDVSQSWVQWCKDKALVDSVSRFVFVSYWQRDRYLAAFGLPPERCVVLRNATEVSPDLRPWEPGPIWRCAYASTPFRGLSVLLDAWQRLGPANAELHIWSSMRLYLGDDGPYKHLYERARSMPGVIYHGVVPNLELRAALRTIHFLVYPSTFEETSCLAMIEAMAAGCRVIVPSLGALPETACGYARVYPRHPDPTAHAEAFSEILADEMTIPWGGEPTLALAQQLHCAAVYDWRRRLDEWRQLIGSVCDGTSRIKPADPV